MLAFFEVPPLFDTMKASVALTFSFRFLPWSYPHFCLLLFLLTNHFRENPAKNQIMISQNPSLAPEISVFFGSVNDHVAEQKARVTYDNILRLSDDPDVNDVIKFLREREIVHFQRFGEAIQLLREKLNQKNVYFMNPAFDL